MVVDISSGFTVTLQVAYFPLPSLALHVMMAEPTFFATTNPSLLTSATALLELQLTDLSVALLGYVFSIRYSCSLTFRVS